VGGWVGANFFPLLFVAAVVALIIWRNLIVADLIMVALGLGLVIFIHELGHFIAAKLCDVHVETFSIGFGKAIPFCQFRYGETLYKIGWIPLGGYVKMVGEGDNADTEEAEEDPRSFKNKSVGQRMIIISAGVIMNIILGCICFMVAYSHGVEETPPIVGGVGVGSPAWQQDVRGGTQILQIESITKPTYEDIRPTVMSAPKDGTVMFVIRDDSGATRTVHLSPRRNPEDLYPMVGIYPVSQLELQKPRRPGMTPVRKGSPADKARAADGSSFQGGDRIVACTDPSDPAKITPIPVDPRDPTGTKLDAQEFARRQFELRGKPMTVRVARGGDTHDFVLEPAYSSVVPDVRFQMGRLAAMRANGPAANAVLVAPAGEPGLQMSRPEQMDVGDKIIAIEIKKGDETIRYVDELSKEKEKNVREILTDPLRLGYDLESWAQTATDRKVRLTVLRAATGAAKTGKRVTYDLQWDPSLVFNGESVLGRSSPMPLSGLGLAYYVVTTIDSAAPTSVLARGDVITHIRYRDFNEKQELEPQKWVKLKPYQGAFLHNLLQNLPSPDVDFKVQRGGNEVEVSVQLVVDDKTPWPELDRGFLFPLDTRIQKADDPIDALGMGLHRTWRTVKVIYQTLYATIFRQISTETLSGPLSIANVSYKIAGYDLWQFILFIGLININLAVVNFLPIPLLDGGHMVFLIYEKIRGKPAPEKLQVWALYLGLLFIILLMLFVIYLDVRKLFF
jgi:regulator of sigma E protease